MSYTLHGFLKKIAIEQPAASASMIYVLAKGIENGKVLNDDQLTLVTLGVNQ